MWSTASSFVRCGGEMTRNSAAHRRLWPQSAVLAVVAAFMLCTQVSATPLQQGGGADHNSLGVFPGKATWGPSPLDDGSLAGGSGVPSRSPPAKVLHLVRPDDAKLVVTSVAMDEVKVGFPSLTATSQIPSRRPFLPAQRPGYTVGGSTAPVGPLVVLKGGISGDSPFVLTRRQDTSSRRFFGSFTRRLN